MAFVRGQAVDIPSLSKKIPPNPLLGYDSNRTAPASTTESSGGMTQSTLAHRTLLYDQRCLVTGAVSVQLRACHLVNTIRMNNSNRAVKAPVKRLVEFILTRQQFGVGNFSLDSLPNCTAIEAQLHGDLDVYGSFCITIPVAQITQVILELVKSNREWAGRAASDPQAKRDLNVKEDPFVVKKCVLLVLRPDLFLPEKRPISINSHRVLRTPGGPSLAQSDEPSWIQYYSRRGSPFLIDSSNLEFDEFEYQSKRRPDDLLSIFSLLVNANSKLQAAAQRPDHPPGIDDHVKLVSHAVDLIFFVPDGLEEQPSSPTSPVPPLPSSQSHNVPGPSTPSRKRRGKGPKGSGAVEEEHSNSDVEEEHSDSDVEEERSDSDVEEERSDSDVEEERPDPDVGFGFDDDFFEEDDEDDEPDTINGLTLSEMETVLQRVSDSTISAKERAEAAMLMLGMAGGHRRPQAISPLIEDYV